MTPSLAPKVLAASSGATPKPKVLVQLGGASTANGSQESDTCKKITKQLTVTKQDIDKGIAIVRKRQESEVAEPEALTINKIRRVPSKALPWLKTCQR